MKSFSQYIEYGFFIKLSSYLRYMCLWKSNKNWTCFFNDFVEIKSFILASSLINKNARFQLTSLLLSYMWQKLSRIYSVFAHISFSWFCNIVRFCDFAIYVAIALLYWKTWLTQIVKSIENTLENCNCDWFA